MGQSKSKIKYCYTSLHACCQVLCIPVRVQSSSGSELSSGQRDERFTIIYMNHMKMILLVTRGRPGLMVRRKFLQRLPLEKMESLL